MKYTILLLIIWLFSYSVYAENNPLTVNPAAGDQSVTLTWDDYDSPDVIGYIVKRNYYNTDAPNSYYQLNTELITGNSYHDDGLTNCVRYSYLVYPVFNDGLRTTSFVYDVVPYKVGETYHFKGETNLSHHFKKGSTYVIEEDFNLKGHARLYIDEGVVVKFKEGAKLTSETQYNLFISRTHEEPIVFTSYKDDEHGGDTNGDGDLSQPQAGDWNTLQVPMWNGNGIPYCKVLYATTGYTFPEVGDNEISHWAFKDCVNAIAFASNTIENTQFSENDIIDCANFMSGEPGTGFSAANNWFGDASGPYNATLSPEGKGCAIADGISFEPYSNEPYLHPYVQNAIADKEFKEDAGEVMTLDLNTIFARPINFDYQLGYSVEIEGEAISAKIENNSLIIETLENKNGTNTIHLKANTKYSTSYDKPYFANLSFNVNITPENDAPTAIQLSNNRIAENSIVGTEIGTLTATDPDADQTFTYSITENEDFEITGEKLISKKEFDFEAKNSYSIEIKVEDQDGLTHTQTFPISVQDINEAPSAIQLSANIIDENAAIGTEVGELTASDEDADQTFTYTIAENENFEIVGDKLVCKVAFDFETQDSYTVEITVSDQGGLSFKQSFSIQITDANEAPDAIQLSNTTIAENSEIGTELGILTARDVDASQTFTYTIAENEFFELAGDKLVSKSVFDYETSNSYSLEITLTDQGDLTFTKSFTITVEDVNESPTAIQLSNATIVENSAIGSEVGTLTASDFDASQTFTYTIAANDNFEIAGDKLVSKVSFDFETLDSYSVEITVTDQGGLTHKQSFSIQITDENEVPNEIQLSNAAISENSAIGSEVGILTASDFDANQIFTYTIVENENFEIVGDKFVSKVVFDFETQDNYSVEIIVADQDGLTHKQSFSIQITDENEAPTAISLSNATIAENAAIGIEVGTLTASDVDASETLTYTIVENENFEIVGEKLVSKIAFDFETKDSYSVEITVADQEGLTHKQSFDIQIIDANEAPSAIALTNATIAENSVIGTEVGELSTTDEDADQTFTYTIAENENFEVVGDKLVSKVVFDFETLDNHSVEISVADQDGLSFKQSFTIQVEDVNETPTAISLLNATITENSAIGTEVGELSTTDEDADQTFTYTIAENENFEVVGDKLVSKVVFDFETLDNHSVEISVADQDGLSFKQSFTIQVEDVNETPTAISLLNATITENSAIGTEVGELSTTDEDADQTFTYTMAENENFEVVGDKLVSKAVFDFETLDNHSVEISVADQDGLSFKQSFSIQISDVNETPTAISLLNATITENTAIGTEVGVLTATDIDADQTFTYTIAENENFEIVGDKLVSKTAFDFETQNTYVAEITVIDQGGLAHKQSFSIQISDVNETPTAISLSNATITENSAIGSEVGILTATDQDVAQTFTFTIAENEFFELAGDKLVSKLEFDYEDNNSYPIEITVADQADLTYSESFTIQIEDANEAPIAILLSNATIAENSAIGTEVGILTATDPDINQTFTFSISENKYFEIDGDRIVSKEIFNFEDHITYSVKVIVTDQGGLSYDDRFTLQTKDVNELPEFLSDPLLVALSGENYTYNIEYQDDDESGCNVTAFEIPSWLNLDDHGDGTATLSGIPTEAGTFNVILEASDSENTTRQEFEIVVETVTGIEDVFTAPIVQIYPNPVARELHIDLSDFRNDETTISLFSTSGSLIFKEEHQNIGGKVKIIKTVQQLQSGVYLLLIESEGYRKSYKIVKQ